MKRKTLCDRILEANALHEQTIALQAQRLDLLSPVSEAANEMTVDEIDWLLTKIKDHVTLAFLAVKKREALARRAAAQTAVTEKDQ